MTLKELGTQFGEALLNQAFSDGFEKFKSKTQQWMQRRKINQYIKAIEKELLPKHGDETYYESLSKFLCRGDIISKIVKRSYDRDVLDAMTDEEFITSLMTTFPSQPYNMERVKEIISTMLKVAFIHFNSNLSDENRKLKNSFMQGLDNVKSGMIEPMKDIRSQLSMITDSLESLESTADKKSTILDIGEFSKLTQADIKSIIAGDIKISGFRFNDPDLYVTISTKICYDAAKFQAQTFDQLIAYLRFCGKQQYFVIAEMSIVTNQGSVIFTYRDIHYKGTVLSLPDVHVKEIDGVDSLANVRSMSVCIAPQIDQFTASIEDDRGAELLAPELYHIERHIEGNDLVASYICSSDALMADVYIDFVFVDKNIENARTDIKITPKKNGRISHKLKRLQSLYALGTTDSYGLINKANEQRIVGWSSPLILTGENSLKRVENSIEICKKLLHIERYLGISFDPEYKYDDSDALWADAVDRLLDNDYIDFDDLTISFDKQNTVIPDEEVTEKAYTFVTSLDISIGNAKIQLEKTPCLVGMVEKVERDRTNIRILLSNCKIFLSTVIADEVNSQSKRILEAKKYFNPDLD